MTSINLQNLVGLNLNSWTMLCKYYRIGIVVLGIHREIDEDWFAMGFLQQEDLEEWFYEKILLQHGLNLNKSCKQYNAIPHSIKQYPDTVSKAYR